MKREKFLAGALVLAFVAAVCAASAWAQVNTGGLKGRVTRGIAPVADVEVVFTNVDTGRQYKAKTDSAGEYISTGMLYANYKVEIIGANKDVLCTTSRAVANGDVVLTQDIDISVVTACAAPAPKMTKEEIARAKAANEKMASLNPLLVEAQTAMQTQKWNDAEKALKKVLAAVPDTTRYDFYKFLGDAQKNNNKLADAAQTYEKGIQVAEAVAAGTAPKDPLNPNPDAGRAKMAVGLMLNLQGICYVKLNKTDLAIASYKKAAENDPNPAMAYYNLCAVEFNGGKFEDAAAACDKSIAADPGKADAWFFKGAALSKAGKPGVADAMNKYLQLDPNGAHAAEAKSLLAQK